MRVCVCVCLCMCVCVCVSVGVCGCVWESVRACVRSCEFGYLYLRACVR